MPLSWTSEDGPADPDERELLGLIPCVQAGVTGEQTLLATGDDESGACAGGDWVVVGV